MASKTVTLALASFLDSSHAKSIDGVTPADVKTIVARFLTAAESMGKPVKDFDGHDMHAVLGHVLPDHYKKKDPLAQHTGDVLRAYLDHLQESEVVADSFELRHSFESTIDEFTETVRTGHNAHHHAPKQAPIVNKAPKLGRNEPCFCGSGKKFKKCHGKA